MMIKGNGEKPMADHYLHHLPGRLRVRNPILKRNSQKAGEVQLFLEGTRGVNLVRLNPVTGSVTIHYTPTEIDGSALIESMTDAGYVRPDLALASERNLDQAMGKAGRALARVAAGVVLDALLADSPLGLIAVIV
jgi:hypothetical protein